MNNLPEPNVYEREFEFMPWGRLIKRVAEIVVKKAPHEGRILDLMCGPGYLLGKIAEKRPDLKASGVDIDRRFIGYAKAKYQNIKFIEADALEWETSEKYDLIICTAGLHHLPYKNQYSFVKKVKSMLKSGGLCIFADPLIDDFKNERERRASAARLGLEYLTATIKNGAPDEVTEAAIDIMRNDVMGAEYKTSLVKIKKIILGSFSRLKIIKTWPNVKSEYGDYILIAR